MFTGLISHMIRYETLHSKIAVKSTMTHKQKISGYIYIYITHYKRVDIKASFKDIVNP